MKIGSSNQRERTLILFRDIVSDMTWPGQSSRKLGMVVGGITGVGLIPLAFFGGTIVPAALVAVAIVAGLALEMRYVDELPPD
jgi:hypothetical protein